MAGIGLTPVQQRPASNRSLILALATMAAVVVFTIGLVGGMNLLNPGNQPGGGGPASLAPSATPAPTKASGEPLAPQAVTGLMSGCETTSTPVTKTFGEVVQTRHHGVRCDLTSEDQRVAGTVALVYNGDREPRSEDGVESPSPGYFTAAVWGTIALDAGDGRWTGVWRGTREESGWVGSSTLTGVFVGQGAYDGLRVRWTLEAPGSNLISGDILQAIFRLTGFVEPVDAIPPDGTTLISGSSTCSDTVPGSVTNVDDVTQIRGAVIDCTGNVVSDPRIDGTSRTILNGDQQADESAAMWGTEEIAVDGAVTWAGEYTGTVAPGYTTHRFAGTDLGYGPYAGLAYEWTMIGDPGSGYVTSGTIHAAP